MRTKVDNFTKRDPYTRHRFIVEKLLQEGRIEIREVAKLLEVSAMTIRRDLEELEEKGLLRRVRGGAVAYLMPEDVGFHLRARQNCTAKKSIAQTAVALLEPGQVVYLDAGTTCSEIAQALAREALKGLRLYIFTHAVNIAYQLSGVANLVVHQIGGEIYRQTYSAVGPTALKTIATLHFDLFFMGACGVHPERGWSNTNFPEVEIKQAVMERTQRTVAVADASKWGRIAPALIAPLSWVDAWIVDREPASGTREQCEAEGIRLILPGELPLEGWSVSVGR